MKINNLNEQNKKQELYGIYYDYFGTEKHPLVLSGYRKWDDAFYHNEVLPISVKRNRLYFKTKKEAEKFIDTYEKIWNVHNYKLIEIIPHTPIELVKVKVDLGDYNNSDIWDKFRDKIENKELSNEEYWEMEKHNYATAYADKRFYDMKVNK